MKTALLRLTQSLEASGQPLPVADLAAAFQLAVVDVLVGKTVQAAEQFPAKQVVLGGGVAANLLLREKLRERVGLPLFHPRPVLCTDNAAMIGAAAYFRFLQGERASLDLDVYPGLSLP